MTTDPRGRWFRVYARQIRQHPKFRDLNGLELGAWTALRSEAELRDSATFVDRADALLVLRRRRVPRPAAMLDKMVALGLFDVRDDGSIGVHDREDHDRPRYPSDDPDKVRERVQKHRDSRSNEPGNDDETTRYENSNDTHVRAPESGAGAASDSLSDEEPSRAREDELPEGWDAPDAIVAYHQITGRYPSDKVIEWLNRLSNDHPEEAIIRFLAEQYAENPNLGTLLSRTETALKLDLHRREKADQRARAQARAKAEEPYRQREREATPEERERAKLQQQAIRIGLRLGIPVPTEADEVRKFVMKHGSEAA